MKLYNIRMTREEVGLTVRALQHLRADLSALNLTENDTVVNLIDYIEAETRL